MTRKNPDRRELKRLKKVEDGTPENLFGTVGIPRRIRSDHGAQRYAAGGGFSRFDGMCDRPGIRHGLSAIRTPEENGKTERFHGPIRREAGLIQSAWRNMTASCADTGHSATTNVLIAPSAAARPRGCTTGRTIRKRSALSDPDHGLFTWTVRRTPQG